MRSLWNGFELPTRVILEESTSTATYGKFIAEPFERGYGITVGNSLRRVLLSSIEGTAPVSVKFGQVNHEFTAIPGVYEDITTIILNLKGLLVKITGNGPEVIRLKKKGCCQVKASDFEVNSNVQVVNPDLVLANIVGQEAELSMEVTVSKGRGYKRAEELKIEKNELGLIPIDATFTPVIRTRWNTEDTRVGQMTNYDRLFLEIWTDGTIKPENALVEAALILRKHLNPFVKYFEIGSELVHDESIAETAQDGTDSGIVEDQEMIDKIDQPVSVLDPSVRAANCLAAEGIKTIRDLVCRQESDMLQVRNFGKTSLKEIKAKLAEMGISFGMDVARKSKS